MKNPRASGYRALRTAMPLAVLLPAIANAQTQPSTFKELVQQIIETLGLLVPFVAALFALMMFWGLAKFIANAGDTKAHETGRFLMFWGTIGLFIMATLYGILAFMLDEAGFGPLGPVVLPE